MMRSLIIPLILVLAGCSYPLLEKEYPFYEREVMSNFPTEEISQVVWDYAADLKYDHRLYIEHAYECVGDETVLHIQFKTQHLLELCEARQLLVDVVEGLLDRLNHSPAAAPFLAPYPLTADQLQIRFDFQSYHGIYIDRKYIGWMVLEDGMVYFYAFSLKEDLHDFFDLRYEPYFKSRSFVHWEREGEKHYKETHRPPLRRNIPEQYVPGP